jgi:hypothetical protein
MINQGKKIDNIFLSSYLLDLLSYNCAKIEKKAKTFTIILKILNHKSKYIHDKSAT